MVHSGAAEASLDDNTGAETGPPQIQLETENSKEDLNPAPSEVSCEGPKLSVSVDSLVNVDGTHPAKMDSQLVAVPEETMDPGADFGLRPEEAKVMGIDVDDYLRQYDPASQSSAITPRQHVRLSQAYKQRSFQHSFPRQPPQNQSQETKDWDSLAIEGRGSRSQRKGIQRRARTAGTVPERAKSSTPGRMLQKQAEMLKKSPVDAYRTPPSIPTPWSQFGTRSAPHPPGNQYMAELEAHSRKVDKPKQLVERGKTLNWCEKWNFRI